jgi:hypothetical protein
MIPRRSFLKIVGSSGVLAALGDLGFLTQLPSVSAAEAALEPCMDGFHPEIESLVRLIEEMPRDRVLEEVTMRVKHGLNYRELLTALLLAGVRNIQPRPVGYKFHAVLVVNSAHLASLASPDTDRWLPILWAVDQFKASQAANAREGDWTMGAVDESAVPPGDYAKNAIIAAMDNWDESAADAAVVGLARTADADELFEIFVATARTTVFTSTHSKRLSRVPRGTRRSRRSSPMSPKTGSPRLARSWLTSRRIPTQSRSPTRRAD